MTTNINDLLNKAMVAKRGGHTPWYVNPPKEVVPFIEGIEEMINSGKEPVASSVHRILNEEFGMTVSRSRVSHWITSLKNKSE